MGYRSDVMIAFYLRKTVERIILPDGKTVFKETGPHENQPTNYAMLKLWFEENYLKDQTLEPDTIDYMPERCAILVSYNDIKWYGGYPEIDHVHNMIGLFRETFNAEDKDGSGSFEFIRLGEDDADIERDHSDWCDFMLGVRREMYSDL